MIDEDVTTSPSSASPENNEVRPVFRNAAAMLMLLLRAIAESGRFALADLKTALGHLRPGPLLAGAFVLLAIGYALTGVYSVSPGEAAVVRRFGTVIQPNVEPGLHYRFPWPVDQVDIVDVSSVRREQVGISTPEEEHVHPEPAAKLQALSGDTNVVDVEVTVQYQVREPANYLLNVQYAPYRIVRDALRAAVTRLVTRLPVDALLTSGRQSLQQAIREETQARLDQYRTGLVIVGIDLQKAFPPADVADAFTAVNTAREEKARLINEARGYANSLVPEARGDAQQVRAQSSAYRSDILARANGAARAFDSLRNEYQKNAKAYGEDITRYRMYLETIERIMPRVQVYALDTAKGGGFNLRLYGAQNGAAATEEVSR